MKNIYKLFEMSSFRFDAGLQALLLHKAEEVQRFLEENCPDFIKVDISPKRQIGVAAKLPGSESPGLCDLEHS